MILLLIFANFDFSGSRLLNLIFICHVHTVIHADFLENLNPFLHISKSNTIQTVVGFVLPRLKTVTERGAGGQSGAN